MAGIDIFTDPSGINDMVLNERGDWRWTETTQESLAQRIKNRLTTWLGEWVYNVNYGTPYRQRLMKGGQTKEQLDAQIRSVIFEEDDITSVSIQSSLDFVNRRYILESVEIYHDNVPITIPISTTTTPTNIYPEPLSFDDFVICNLGNVSLSSINELHMFINHEGLPINGNSTWWNLWSGV